MIPPFVPVIRDLPTKCPNINCGNEIHQGMFSTVSFGDVMVVVCKPCAFRIQEAIVHGHVMTQTVKTVKRDK